MPLIPTGAVNDSHLNPNGTTTIKSGAGWLHNIVINVKGSSGNTITVYDNTAASGTIIAVIDPTAQLVTLNYDVGFTTGLTVVLASGTAADITVSYV
jgi:hypothetical protein